jgi:hypothetical protein
MDKKAEASGPHLRPRKIVGFSLSPEFAAEVKMEAARRGLSLRQLLEEMWALYKSKGSS